MDINVRKLLKKVKDTAIDAGHAAGKVGKDIWDQAKLGIRLAELNSKVDEEYTEIGKLLYNVHCGKEVEEAKIDEYLASLDSLNKEIESVKAEIAKYAKNTYVCPNCGKSIKKTDLYCSSCGFKIEKDEPVQEEEKSEDKAAEDTNEGSACCTEEPSDSCSPEEKENEEKENEEKSE